MHRGCMTTLAIGSNKSEGSAACMRLHAKTSRTTTKNRARLPILILQRQFPDSPSGRGKDRVGQRRCRHRCTWLTDSSRGLTVSHQVHFDRRRLIYPQDANIMEVRLLHAPVLERHLAVQGAADSEDDAALDLRFHS